MNWSPTVTGVGYQTFFAQVRAVNESLPSGQHIRVLLGEPPIDWSSISTGDEWQKIYDQREQHAAGVIENEILGRNRKALVIYGTGHFFSYPWPSTWPVPSAGTDTLGEIVERRHPGAFFFVTPYGGYKDPACSAAFEAEMNWPRRILVSPIRDTPLEEILMQPECITGLEDLDPPIPADELARLEQRFHEIDTGVAGQPMAPLAVTLPSWALPPQPWRRP